MGTTYQIYHEPTKRYLDLGKLRGWLDDGQGPTRFDASADKIAQFIAQRTLSMDDHTAFVIYPDTGNCPEDDDPTWKEVDR